MQADSTLRGFGQLNVALSINRVTTKIFGFSNNSSWLIDLCLLMDMSISIKGLNHVIFANQLDYNDLFD